MKEAIITKIGWGNWKYELTYTYNFKGFLNYENIMGHSEQFTTLKKAKERARELGYKIVNK